MLNSSKLAGLAATGTSTSDAASHRTRWSRLTARPLLRRALTAALASGGMMAVGCAGPEAPQAFKILVEHPGVYAVSWDQLSLAGLGERRPSSADLGVTHLGEPVPIWVVDGGDGSFDPGDHFELVGEARAGERSYYNEHDPWNAYRLTFDGSHAARFRTGQTADPAQIADRADASAASLSVREHLEIDQLMLRFATGRDGVSPEPWYWVKLTQIDRNPFKQLLDLSTLDRESDRPLALRIELRGWSKQWRKDPDAPADHRVEVLFNHQLIGSGEWNGQESHVIEIPEVPRELLRKRDEQLLQLRVPQRTAEGNVLVDVVMLNWIEIEFPRTHQLGEVQERLFLDRADPGTPIRLEAPVPPVLYSADTRIELGPGASSAFVPPAAQARLYAAPPGSLLTPERVVLDQPSDLRHPQRQADYLMIAHRSLMAETEPLAEMHRERGLAVEVVDVEDIYDEFSHGLVDPRAIRDFVGHAYHQWQEPRPRFVLLVGDASWDTRNEDNLDKNYADWTYRGGEVRKFWKNNSTSYDNKTGASRNLIPTWHYQTHEGHAASDNFFANVAGKVDGDADSVYDYHPELAIGRLPVTEPEEVAQIVDKTRRYMESPQVGPWKRRVLWITNENRIYQRQDDSLALKLGNRGYASTKIYPKPQEKDNVHHQQALVDAFDDGNLLVHFIGHGGRYIWRTGPPDIRKNHDLFTLDHLDQLEPHDRLPVVLSLTCYSAPFDHPSADSIGEKFLRLADRGAVAVFAASWRNNPTAWMGEVLTKELTDPAVDSVGEAIRLAKRQIRSPELVETYNLLGDPAIPLARPQLELELEVAADRRVLLARLPTKKFNGRAIVDWHDPSGELLETQELAVRGSSFEIPCPTGCGEPGGTVRIYAWDERRDIDAVGGVTLEDAAQQAVRDSEQETPRSS